MKNSRPVSIYEKFVKRFLDILLACFLLLLFCWLYALTALLVKINIGSPVFFLQERAGKDEKIFRIIKFRTMKAELDENGKELEDGKRITRFGGFLRSISLDEIPEILNVLRGEMSFVGPRPLLKDYLPFYTDEERMRHTARPGITGLAQINGRNCVESWEKRFEYDIEYVKNISFWTDLKILLKSFKTVFSRKGVELDGGIKEGPLDKMRGGK